MACGKHVSVIKQWELNIGLGYFGSKYTISNLVKYI